MKNSMNGIHNVVLRYTQTLILCKKKNGCDGLLLNFCNHFLTFISTTLNNKCYSPIFNLSIDARLPVGCNGHS